MLKTWWSLGIKKKEFKNLSFLFLSWMSVVLFTFVVAPSISPYREGSEYTSLHARFSKMYSLPEWFLGLGNFDGMHYLDIADRGYIEEARFFPLFPLMVRSLAWVLAVGNPQQIHSFLAGILISWLSAFGSVLLLFRLIQRNLSTDLAWKTVILWLFFPTSFFLVTMYTESLFVLLTLFAIDRYQMRDWKGVMLACTLLSVTRLVGWCVGLVLAIQFMNDNYNLGKFKLFSLLKYWWLSLLSVPMLLWSYFNWLKWQDWLYFLHAHGQLSNGRETSGIVFPLQTVWRYIKIIVNLSPVQHEWRLSVFELLCFGFGILGLYLAWKKGVSKMWIWYGLLAFMIPTLSGTFSGLPRYLLISFPIFIGFASIMSWKAIKILTTVSLLFLMLMVVHFARGYFVA